MKTWNLLRSVLAAAAAVVIAGCTANGGTIYATIETEVQTTDNTLSNTLTVANLATTVPGTYFVAAGTVYKGVLAAATNTVAWVPNATLPARTYNPTADSLANALALFNGNFWGGFVTGSANLGLYEAAGTEPTSWVADTDPNVSGKQVILLKTANNHLFMVGATLGGSPSVYQYDLEYRNATGPWSAPLLSGIASKVVGVTYAGGRYYLATTTSLSSDGGEPPTTFATPELSTTTTPALATSDQINGIFGDPVQNRVFVMTKLGGLYEKIGAGAWTQIAAPVVSSVTVGLLSMAGPVDAGNDLYLVGSDAYGYFTFSVSGGSLTRFADSTIGLYLASVNTILVDSPNVLMGTNGAGLWRAAFDATGTLSGAWTHE